MSEFDAGLPNKRVTSGFQVGDIITSAEIGSWFFRNNGNEMWLKHGVILAAAGYPQAKLVDYLRVHGLAGTQTTNTSSGAGYGEFATDGSGKWVFAFGHATNVLVSVDDQRNWAAVAHNCLYAVTSVTYSSALTLFIGGGNNSTTFSFCTQTPANVATAWTVRTGTAITTGTSDTTLVRAGPNEVVAVCVANGAGAGQASYSTNATAWTAKNFAGGLASSFLTTALVNCGGSNWYYQQNSIAQKSTDGQTWANVTTPSSGMVHAAFAFNQLFCTVSDGSIYSSPLGATGTFTSLGAPLTSNKLKRLFFDGTRLLSTLLNASGSVFQPAFAWSLDGASWFVRGISKSWVSTVESSIGASGNTIGFMPIGAAGSSYSSFSTPDFIGIPWVTANAIGSFAAPVFYSKVKG